MPKKKTKKKYRVLGVSRHQRGDLRPIDQYAAAFEAAMNDLVEDGYSVHIRNEENGVLLLGELEAQSEDITAEIAAAFNAEKIRLEALAEFSTRTIELLKRFVLKTNGDIGTIEQTAEGCTGGYSAMELKDAMTEIRMHLTDGHRDGAPCKDERFLKAVLAVLDQQAQQRMI
jgi:hypothetical protein